MEELFLDTFFPLDELDVVDQQDVDVAVTAFERRLAVIAQGVDEVVREFLGRHVLDPHPGKQALRVVTRGMQQMGFAQPGLTPDEQRVVGAGGRLGDGERGSVGEPVGRPDDKGLEGVAAVEVDRGFLVGGGVERPVGEVGRPALFCASEGFGDLVDLVGFQDRRLGRGRKSARAVVGFVGGRGDADTEFDALAELAAERGDDRLAQVPFDLVLHKRGRHRQQSKPLGDDERFDEFQPSPLLGVRVGMVDSPLATPAGGDSPLSSATTVFHTETNGDRGPLSMTSTPSRSTPGTTK